MDNMMSVERVKLRDIIAVIRDIFSTSKDVENDKLVNKKLQAVYEVEKEIGATKGIMSAEKFLEKYTSKSSRKKSIRKVEPMEVEFMEVSTKSIGDELENIIKTVEDEQR